MIRDIDPIPTNTRLIASAPELLQALQAAQAILIQLTKPDMRQSAIAVYFQAREAEVKARAAIKLATGEEC